MANQRNATGDQRGARVQFREVSKNFGTVAAAHRVTLDVSPGEFVTLLGPSGSGKTTLLNLAAGLVKPSSGQVKVEDIDLSTMSDQQLSSLRSRKIGFVFQFPSLLPTLTVRENVSLPSIFTGHKANHEADKHAKELIGMMGLSDKMDVYPRQLSAGEQKRTVLARSLINRPQLILADEPTSDLDSNTEKEVMEILRNINSSGVTFVIVTHSSQLVPFATRAFEMQNGSLRLLA